MKIAPFFCLTLTYGWYSAHLHTIEDQSKTFEWFSCSTNATEWGENSSFFNQTQGVGIEATSKNRNIKKIGISILLDYPKSVNLFFPPGRRVSEPWIKDDIHYFFLCHIGGEYATNSDIAYENHLFYRITTSNLLPLGFHNRHCFLTYSFFVVVAANLGHSHRLIMKSESNLMVYSWYICDYCFRIEHIRITYIVHWRKSMSMIYLYEQHFCQILHLININLPLYLIEKQKSVFTLYSPCSHVVCSNEWNDNNKYEFGFPALAQIIQNLISAYYLWIYVRVWCGLRSVLCVCVHDARV